MRDSGAFDEFYRGTAARVVAQIYFMTGDRAEAEDAVQEAYARAWRRWATVSDYDDPVAWVRSVAYRIAVSSWRRTQNRLLAQLRFGAATPAELPELSPDTVALVAALRRIPPVQRRAIVLHHLACLTVREVAAETGASESAVKAQLARGRRAMAPMLSLEPLDSPGPFDDVDPQEPMDTQGSPDPEPQSPDSVDTRRSPAAPNSHRLRSSPRSPDSMEEPHVAQP